MVQLRLMHMAGMGKYHEDEGDADLPRIGECGKSTECVFSSPVNPSAFAIDGCRAVGEEERDAGWKKNCCRCIGTVQIHAVKNKGRENYPGHQLGVRFRSSLNLESINQPAARNTISGRNVIP